MVNQTLENELRQHLDRLQPEQQEQVLAFARALSAAQRAPVRGVPGQSLIRFGGAITAADLDTIARAIEEACEKVHPDEW
jgi:hypothetical protein